MDILTLNKKAWDKIGEKAAYPKMAKDRYYEVFDLFCRKLPKNGSVLDLGCGPGIPVTKELVNRGFNVTAIDFSGVMIKLAKRNVPECTFRQISMTEIDYEGMFDGIISGYTMLCLDPKDFRKTAGKISRALKENGLFFIALNEPKVQYKEKDYYTKIDGETIYSRPYSEEEIRTVFSKYTMEVIQVKRQTHSSEMYGKEYCLIMLLQKK